MQTSNARSDSSVALVDALRSLRGSLIEIYVLHADRETWRAAIRLLALKAEGFELIVDGRLLEVTQWDEVDFSNDSTRLLRAYVEGVEWTSTLFREDQVEFQISPEDFPDVNTVNKLLSLLQGIADATGRPASLMPETVRPEEARPLASAQPGEQEL